MSHTLNSINTFQMVDYILFSILLALSAIIGLYFGFCGNKQDSPEEYLHGGRKMKILPIAASLIASEISGITMLGVPADVYTYGSSYAWSLLSFALANLVVIYVYVPVLHNLGLTSGFEYLKIRFSGRIRTMASAIYALTFILLTPIVMYPAILTFAQVSQINLNLITVIVCITCTAYTTLGGMKAVVWTDTLQVCVMVVTYLTVLCLGVSLEPGGFQKIWKTNLEGGRIDYNLGFDPTKRTAPFTIFVGLTVYYSAYGYYPVCIQRYLSLPTLKKSKLAALLFVLGVMFFRSCATSLGLIIYSRYSTCDPISTGSIQQLDQLVPYYVMDTTGSLPGLPGTFIAGIFCGAISSMSSLLNSLSGMIYEDFIKDRMPATTTKKRASDIMKIIVALFGILSMFLVFAVQFLGGVLELLLSVQGALAGPILAMYTLGMLLPIVNEKGIFYGSVGGSLIMLWLAVGAKYYAMTGQLLTKKLPVTTDGCLITSNLTISDYTILNAYLEAENTSEPFYLYRISFHYYALIGVIATMIIALPLSWFTRKNNEIVDTRLLSPVIYKFLSKQNYTNRRQGIQDDTELDYMNQKFINNN